MPNDICQQKVINKFIVVAITIVEIPRELMKDRIRAHCEAIRCHIMIQFHVLEHLNVLLFSLNYDWYGNDTKTMKVEYQRGYVRSEVSGSIPS